MITDPLAALPLATLQTWLAAAQAAYQKLMIGGAAVEVMTDGYLARFQRADGDKLLAYISRLQAAIAQATTGECARIGAIGVIF